MSDLRIFFALLLLMGSCLVAAEEGYPFDQILIDKEGAVVHNDLYEIAGLNENWIPFGSCSRSVGGVAYTNFVFKQFDKYGESIGVVLKSAEDGAPFVLASGDQFGTNSTVPEKVDVTGCDTIGDYFIVSSSDPYAGEQRKVVFDLASQQYSIYSLGWREGGTYLFEVDDGFFVYGVGLCKQPRTDTCYQSHRELESTLQIITGISEPTLTNADTDYVLGRYVSHYFIGKEEKPKCSSLFMLHQKYFDHYEPGLSLYWTLFRDVEQSSCIE